MSAGAARRTWHELALPRALDDDAVHADRAVYSYLCKRGLMNSWNERLFGVLAMGMDLPADIAWWPGAGNRVVVPIYDARARVVAMQALSIRDGSKMNSPGQQPRPAYFANADARRLLTGDSLSGAVVIGEGLTDFLALGAAIPSMPVLGIPGSSFAAGSIGEWVARRKLVLALDDDRAGEHAAQVLAAEAREYDVDAILRIRWGRGRDAADSGDQIEDILCEAVA